MHIYYTPDWRKTSPSFHFLIHNHAVARADDLAGRIAVCLSAGLIGQDSFRRLIVQGGAPYVGKPLFVSLGIDFPDLAAKQHFGGRSRDFFKFMIDVADDGISIFNCPCNILVESIRTS